MDYLSKGEVLTNTDLDRFVNNIWEKKVFCVRRKSLRSMSSAHEKWGQKQKCCVYNLVQCSFSEHLKALAYFFVVIFSQQQMKKVVRHSVENYLSYSTAWYWKIYLKHDMAQHDYQKPKAAVLWSIHSGFHSEARHCVHLHCFQYLKAAQPLSLGHFNMHLGKQHVLTTSPHHL